MRGPKLLAAIAFSTGTMTLACEAQTPMAYLRTSGRMGREIDPLLWGLIVVSIVVVLIISGLILFGVFRRSRNTAIADVPLLESHATQWISTGVGISTLVLIGLVIWT